MIKFTQITDSLNYPPKIRGRLSTLHSDVIAYAIDNFKNTTSFKQKVISTLNTLSYYTISGDTLPDEWNPTSPIGSIECVDPLTCKYAINDIFIELKDIVWDAEEVDTAKFTDPGVTSNLSKRNIKPTDKPDVPVEPTPKDHLYIKPPLIPQ